jgi:hypothetical protein
LHSIALQDQMAWHVLESRFWISAVWVCCVAHQVKGDFRLSIRKLNPFHGKLLTRDWPAYPFVAMKKNVCFALLTEVWKRIFTTVCTMSDKIETHSLSCLFCLWVNCWLVAITASLQEKV